MLSTFFFNFSTLLGFFAICSSFKREFLLTVDFGTSSIGFYGDFGKPSFRPTAFIILSFTLTPYLPTIIG